ncbi:SMI1/KNR4 family protein [Tenacibaculum finnmarkense]|uniref:SMI1/KNR4 family protein n=1 Tax=Tenacibaculum finnmarkense TaxID=2781243 RepID=UPI001E3937CD|nr:SMI1/KNR4 family protein [Tenacibaculum finnmarkense]MCD8401442.1 SMI1/KNR4 family protein [Tenacibaculum finnmarkense genomovar ulcerans]MCG8786444.1 SMI1/KNR4 family protein [Tenacibaculum finnmarkense]MCG8814131.1 SMI1/KNR4 family protein [Tenacibaculum finnmarkense]
MLEIKSKSEIIIPFENIGDNNWSEKTQYIITELADNWNNKPKEPISDKQIQELEEKLKTELPIELKLFYKKFGIAGIGEQLQDFNEIGWIKDIWKDQLEYGPDFTVNDKTVLPFLVSFSDYLGNGNMFCFHSETKEIYYFDHDTKPYLTKLFNNASDYIKGCLISCQSDLFNQEIGQEKVEEWCEEILDKMFGEDIVEKWKY